MSSMIHKDENVSQTLARVHVRELGLSFSRDGVRVTLGTGTVQAHFHWDGIRTTLDRRDEFNMFHIHGDA